MHGYTHDLESVDLTPDEHAAFGHLVRSACDADSQNRISCFLASVTRPQNWSVMDFLGRQAEKMLSAEAKL